MTRATERIRALLDERGVEYRTHGTTDRTWFEVGNISWFVIEREKGSLTADAVSLTPEQAIAVTLGTGVNCSKAEHDAGGCLGFQSGDDDEPVDQCKACHKYTSYEVEL